MSEVNVENPGGKRRDMKIIDLNEEKKNLFCLCLEDWSDDAKEAGSTRHQWLGRVTPILQSSPPGEGA